MRNGNFFCAWMAISIFFACGQEEDWARWRGPTGNGFSPECIGNPTALLNGPEFVWKTCVGNGHSNVAIKGEYLYTMGNIKDQDIVYCLKADSGKEVWRFSYESKGGSYPGPRASPVVAGSYVYTLSRYGKVYCLNAETGLIQWQRDLAVEFGAKNLIHGFSASPCIEGSTLILNIGRNGMAFHKDTGEKIWISDPHVACGYATPVIIACDGKKYAAILTGKALYAVDIATGRYLWSYPWETNYDLNAADPVVADGRIFISTWDDKGSALLDITGENPRLVWQNKCMKNLFSTSILLNGYIYGFDGTTQEKAALKCVDFNTGEEKWSKEFEYGNLIAADGKLIILDQQGTLFIVRATSESYQELAKCAVLPVSNQVKSWAAPVLCRGKIYCRNTAGDLVCIEVTDGL